MAERIDTREAQALVDKFYWWHTIDLGNGVWTKGTKSRELLDNEYEAVFEPLDLKNKSVLDVGAWNGAFAFEAHRRGARPVTALDHHAWNHPRFRGREAFDLACRLKGVDLKAVDRDLNNPQLDLGELGTFDIVLFLGVFYHLIDPIAGLREVSRCTREVLVLESHVERFPDNGRPIMTFFPGEELNHDASNWWGPNRTCLVALLKHFGFERVEVSSGGGPDRDVFQAYRS
jgi:tRNA (mo5U34)-methyltransferase